MLASSVSYTINRVMTDKKLKNHPLEDLLEIETGSTPNITGNPFLDADDNSIAIDEDEIGEDEFYEEHVDNTMQEVMLNAPPPVINDFYDHIDQQTDRKFNTIYNAAMDAFSKQVQEATLVEGRFRARNLEVAAQFLKIGLDSAKDSATQKANKDKHSVAVNKGSAAANNTQNNIFVGNRNDLMKIMKQAEAEIKVVDGVIPDDDTSV